MAWGNPKSPKEGNRKEYARGEKQTLKIGYDVCNVTEKTRWRESGRGKIAGGMNSLGEKCSLNRRQAIEKLKKDGKSLELKQKKEKGRKEMERETGYILVTPQC